MQTRWKLINAGFRPLSSCGLGQNLYVEPSGKSFPCYACNQPASCFGNVITLNLDKVLDNPTFRELCLHTVDMNQKCPAIVIYAISAAASAVRGM